MRPRAIPCPVPLVDALAYKIVIKEMQFHAPHVLKIPAEVWLRFFELSPKCECGQFIPPPNVLHAGRLTSVLHFCSSRCRNRAAVRRKRYSHNKYQKKAALEEAAALADALRYV